MSLQANELAEVCREIAATLVGQPVQKIVQPDARTVLFSFPAGWLRLDVHPQFGRLHLDDKPVGTGEAAPAFCMLLRKHLQSAKLSACDFAAETRTCVMRFERRADAHRCRLELVLYGRSAKLTLLDDSIGTPSDGRARSSDGGAMPSDGAAMLGEIGEIKSPLSALPASPGRPSRFSSSREMAAFFRAAEADAIEAAARAKVKQSLDNEHKRLSRLIAGLHQDLARADRIEQEKKWADLIFAHLREVPRGASSVALPDSFTDGEPIEIKLDPALSPTQNAERYYKNVRRFGRSRPIITARLQAAENELARVTQARAELPSLAASGILTKRDALAPAQAAGKPGQRVARSAPYHEYSSIKGAPIWVGRGAARNDELTFKVARGTDLWLHARDVPGAHVVVPLGAGSAIDAELLVDAATLAAHHSNARDEQQVDITYTLRKNVRRIPKAQAGQVTLSDGKTIRVRIEPDRLQRLLATKK